MKIVVCISNVPDTTTKIRLSSDGKSIETAGIQWIINPWDELALSRAIDIKESSNGIISEVVVVNVGNKDTEPTIRKALAMGADRGIRINCEPSDAYFVAGQLANAIKNEGFDIILCGIESSDFNGFGTGLMLAEFLDIPSVSSVSSINIEANIIKITREIDGGSEEITIEAPLIAIVQKGIAIEPKIPSMRGIMMARTKPLNVIEPISDITPLTYYIAYEMPKAKSACRMISEDNVKELADLLKNETKVF